MLGNDWLDDFVDCCCLMAAVIILLCIFCPVQGCQSRTWTHQQSLDFEQRVFDRQKYERRYQSAVEETEVFFSFTNRLGQRDKEPMDLVDVGKLFCYLYGTNIAWQVVTTAYADYSQGAPEYQATNIMWLQDQTPRTRDTAWMINYRDEWFHDIDHL